MTNELAIRSDIEFALARAKQQLDEAQTLEEVIPLGKQAEALAAWARIAKLDIGARNEIAEHQIWTDRKAGEMLAKLSRGNGNRYSRTSNAGSSRSEYAEVLQGAKVTMQEANRKEKQAKIPTPKLKEFIAENKEHGKELTTAGVLRLAKNVEQEQRRADANNGNNGNQHDASIVLYQDDALLRLPLLSDDSLALVVADPPYNVTGYDWDRIGSESDYLTWTDDWLTALRPKLKSAYHLFVFCDPDYVAALEMLLRRREWPLKSRIIWEYRNLVKGRDVTDKFIENWQMCFHCGTHALNWPPIWTDSRFMVQQHAAPQSNFNEGKNHPMAKPLDLIKLLVTVGSKPGDTILDPFAGGGTTGKAVAEVGQRQCILIEYEDLYCGEIEKRLGISRMSDEVVNG